MRFLQTNRNKTTKLRLTVQANFVNILQTLTCRSTGTKRKTCSYAIGTIPNLEQVLDKRNLATAIRHSKLPRSFTSMATRNFTFCSIDACAKPNAASGNRVSNTRRGHRSCIDSTFVIGSNKHIRQPMNGRHQLQ